MSLAEFWFGDVMERRYTIAMTFDSMDIKEESAWKQLDLPGLKDIIQVRMLVSGTPAGSVCSAPNP